MPIKSIGKLLMRIGASGDGLQQVKIHAGVLERRSRSRPARSRGADQDLARQVVWRVVTGNRC